MEVPLNSLIPHKDIGAGQQFYLTYDQETFNIDLTGMIGVHLQFTYIWNKKESGLIIKVSKIILWNTWNKK